MSYELTTRVEDNVLIATVTGSRNLRTVVAVAQEIKSSCKKHGVDKVLIDVQRFEGRLRDVDAFFLVTKHFKVLRDRRVLRKAAVLDRSLSHDRHRFLENIAVNRGYKFHIFDDYDEAMEWVR